jgi:hypothetical protein
MKNNKIHCLIINQSTVLTAELSRALRCHKDQSFVEVIDGILPLLKAKVVKHKIGLLFIAKTSASPSFEAVAKLLRQYSPDTILVFLTAKNQPITQDILGVERCDLSLNTASVSNLVISNLLHYAQIKKDLRECKHLLSIVDRRNRWLVDSTYEPIAYVYQGAHIHANSAYLALFGFHSVAELMGTAMNELLPVVNQTVFSRFVNKQKNYLDTQQTLLVTMQTIDKQAFRAGIRVASAVINNTKCLQVWVHKLGVEQNDSHIQTQKQSSMKVNTNTNTRVLNGASLTPRPLLHTHTMNINRAKKGEVGVLKEKLSLKQLIAFAQENQLNKLDIQPLKAASLGAINHYFVDMPLNPKRVNPVRIQLKNVYGMNAAMFQDYVTITSLIAELRKKGVAGERYIVKLNVANLQDKRFSRWLSVQLQQLPTNANASQIVFLLPYAYCKKNIHQLAGLLYSLKNTGGCIGLSSFTPSAIGMKVVKRFQVKYISFDPEWLECVRANKRQREVLSTLTQKLGRSGIEVIVSPSKAA